MGNATYASIDIKKLKFDPENARLHPDSNLKAIMGSLKEFGQQMPILVTRDRTVVAGNGTLRAAIDLGWKEIQVRYTDLKGDTARALALAMNRTAELAEWDMPVLGQSLQALMDTGFDIAEIGFDPGDWLKDVVPSSSFDETRENDLPSNVPSRVKRGEVWQLGNHRLMCGDSTRKEEVDRLFRGDIPNLMVTDPPYGVNLDQSWRDKALGDKAMGKGNSKLIQNDDRADWQETYAIFPGNIAYIWHASKFNHIVRQNLEDVGLEVRQMIIWNKSVMIMGRSAYHWKHEPCWYAVRKGKDANWLGDRSQVTVWDAAPPNHIMGGSKDDKTDHPSQKPLKIYEIPIHNHTNVGDSIYEPFAGSGSAIIAAEKTGRRCLAMELDPAYCDIILQRWENISGRKAELLPRDAQ